MIRAFAERDRDTLFKMSKPLLAVFKENPYFATIGWILPDNTVFLRIHAPGLHGDDVTPLRPDIVATNRDETQNYGFDGGVSGMQYRVVQPVFYQEKYIGAVQFGIKASFIFDALKKSTLNTHAGMAVLNEESATILKSNVPKLVCGEYTIRSRDVEIYQPLLNQLNWNKTKQKVILHEKEHVILNILPVNNFQNKQLGVFFVALQISEELANTQKLLVSILVISALLLVISFLILYFSYGSLVEKIVKLNCSLEVSNSELEARVQERTTELYESEKQLHRAQKMEAIGLMASGVAHDLNNILSAIISYPELMLLDLPESSKLRKPIEAIQESGMRAAIVVADLLTVARGAASIREKYDINLLIREYLDSPECLKLKELHPETIIKEQLLATQTFISCSPVHIKKVVMNLMTNAMEAIDGTGEIVITTRNLKVNRFDATEHSMEPGEYLLFTVQDNGPGIADKDIEHIFEPFYTRKVMGQSGSGLGLAVVWNTMEDHGGKVLVKSNTKGTTFTLYFSVYKGQETVQVKNNRKIASTGGNEDVLVIDDEPYLQDIAKKMLQFLGYKVNTVDSGEAAIDFVKQTPVDLLVIDMLMDPGLNGRETYEEILKLYPEQKAIIVSGFSESDDVKAALQLGAGGFMKKPYSLDRFGRLVKDVLEN
jgi:signal transduction histidine kinase